MLLRETNAESATLVIRDARATHERRRWRRQGIDCDNAMNTLLSISTGRPADWHRPMATSVHEFKSLGCHTLGDGAKTWDETC
mmetsp:Transcript_112306/g.223171  ORF Transcript_112306/g.223171 Transcript_112306/m.223171 type:complete len:83 (-) Transcript_112306:66-314(-)